jgi:methionyl-tRNA formyltransferase
MTVMQMEEGLDSGPILYQAALPIGEDETAGQLHDRLAVLGGKAIVRTLDEMARKGLSAVPQDEALATYAPKIEREDGLVDWGLPAARVSALIRALDPRPGAYTRLKGEEIKLFSARVATEDRPPGVPGRADCRKGGLFVETGEGVVEIREIQVSGRRRLPACDFLRGCAIPEGTVLGT